MTLLLIFARQGSFPPDFTAGLKQHLASTRGELHLGTWSPYAKGEAIHDYTALAAWLNREDASYFREHIAAMKDGPIHWASQDPAHPLARPRLVFELDALKWLGLLGPLTTPEKARLATLEAEAAVLKVSLGTLMSEYRDNEVRADSEFKGKVVQFSGTVAGVEKDVLDHIIVRVGRNQFENVSCYVQDAQAAARLNTGDAITVRGQVDGMTLKQVAVRDCGLVHVE